MYCDATRCDHLTKGHEVPIDYRAFQITRAELNGHSEFAMNKGRASEWRRTGGRRALVLILTLGWAIITNIQCPSN